MGRSGLKGSVCGFTLAVGLAAPAWAQQEPAPPPAAAAANAPSEGLSDIVVYAERRSAGAQLQKVPMSVTAVDASTMAAAHTVDLRDIGRLVPNAQLDGVGTFPGFANFFMRGVGVSTSIRSIDPAVNVVQDGMVIGYQAGAVLDTFDLEGVEVLRGPQGVLFGRNASGGAVVLRSRRPGSDFQAHFDATIGNFNTFDTHSSIEGGLIPDVLNGRISFSTRRNSGYFKNTTKGIFVPVATNPNVTGQPILHPTGGIPKTREYIVKPTFVLTASPTTTVTLFTQYQNYDDGGGPSYAYVPKQGTLTPLQTAWGYTPTTGKYETNISTIGYTKIEAYHAIAELAQQIGDRDSLTVTAAYRHVTYDSTLNVSGDPFDLTVFPDGREKNYQKSVEARYNGHVTDDIEILLGAFYFDTTTKVQEYRVVRNNPLSTVRQNQISIWDQDVRSYAFFGNVDWHVLEPLTLSAGLRYSNDKKDMHIIPLASCAGENFVGCPTTYFNSSKTWDNFSPRFVANYQPTDDLTFFASYSKGYRAGNYNARATTQNAAITPANPETVGSFELGAKTQFLDRHVRLNVTGFSSKYDDIQRIVQGSANGQAVQSLFNAASATIKGVEVEGSVLPLRGLRFDGSVGYTQAKYKSFNGLSGLPAGVLPTDLEFDRVPKWTYHIEGSYAFDVGNGQVSARAAYTHRSHVFTDVNNTPELEQDGFGLIDASISYDSGPIRVSVFGRNLGNTFYADIRSRGTGYQAYGGSPRTYGVQAGYTFGK